MPPETSHPPSSWRTCSVGGIFFYSVATQPASRNEPGDLMMHVVVRTYSGKGTKEFLDLLEKHMDESVRKAKDCVAKHAGETGVGAPKVSDLTAIIHVKQRTGPRGRRRLSQVGSRQSPEAVMLFGARRPWRS